VAAGESSGCLEEMLNRLAILKQKELRLRNSILGAMIYPSLLISLAVVMLIIMLIFIVPKFTLLFSSLDVPLPPSTQALVLFSTVFKRFWWAVFLGVGLLIFGTAWYLRTDRGRLTYDALILKLPLVGKMVKSFATARIVRVLGVLMAGHVPVLKALHLVKASTGNHEYRTLVSRAEEYVTRGEAISAAFADPNLISPSVHEAIRSGEQSGQVDQLLLNVAEFLEDENEVIVRSLTTIIEPVILVGMGILIGLIAVSMFMPLFDLTALTQGG
jgi:type II secretory pathway component PulF